MSANGNERIIKVAKRTNDRLLSFGMNLDAKRPKGTTASEELLHPAMCGQGGVLYHRPK